ncbi:MAG TPA: NACHT domain-containing protein [Thermoanaerobaculia bacterium]|nr:NACHT domain-containing protein [Thermoanaerobaculia bacterium]
MSELAHLLADLYPDRDAARFFMRDVGLAPEEVYLETSPLKAWERILEEAWKHRKVEAVVETAARKYESRRPQLELAAGKYLESRDALRKPPPAAPSKPHLLTNLFRYALDRWLPRVHLFLTRAGGLSEPPERADVVRYLDELKGRIRNDMREKTYLPLAGRSMPSSPLAHAAGRDPFVAPIHQVILELVGRAQGGDSASAQIAAVNRRSRVVRDVLRVLDSAEEPLILLGEPGSGKTMTLQQAAMALAARESNRVFSRAVLFVRLGEFHVEGKVGADDVRDYVREACPPELRRRLDDLERSGRLVIFFDGMDEMSRDRYSEHTEALSVFAGSTRAKTLFSCRITDFSPTFVHRRLVLLPFDRRQVSQYLQKYVESFPIVIDKQPWKLGALARRIVRGDLPIEANNPFVLWLLCFYLQEKGAWPASRVELLDFYNESNYARKQAELEEDEPSFPDRGTVLREWARFAYAITERNRGPVIPVQLLAEGRDSAIVSEMVRVGKRCGVLRESKDGHEHLVRFEHHRFQEYFTAYYIHEAKPEVVWLDKLDAPRWQETMLNLILMGDTGGATRDLTRAIMELGGSLSWWTRDLDPSANESIRLPDGEETVLADRLELSSRILRQSSGAPAVRQALLPPFKAGVRLLADHGNPITQVKMMRACQNVPEVDFIKILRRPFHSPIHWVRNQALILLAESGTATRAAGSDLATEMGHDLANGLFPVRLPAYVKAVKAAGKGGYWWALLAGTLCFALNLFLLFAAAGALYYGTWSLRAVHPDLSPLAFLILPGAIALFGFLIAIAAAAAIKMRPSMLWAVVLGSAFGLVILGLNFVFLWQAAPFGASIGLFVADLFGGFFIVSPIISIGGALFHFTALSLYLAATASVRSSGHGLGAFLSGAWQSCRFQAAFKALQGFFKVVLPVQEMKWNVVARNGTIGVVFVVSFAVCYFLAQGLSGMPFDPWLDLGIAAFLALAAACLTYAAWRKQLASFPAFLGSALLMVLVIGVANGFAILGLELLDRLSTKSSLWGKILQGLVVVLCLALLAALLFALWHLLLALSRLWLTRAQKFPPGSFTPDAWIDRLESANAEQQNRLLVRTDPQALSLTAAEFLEVLREIHPLIQKEPALSTYWDQRDQLEQVLKQERHG